ncbi:MAG: hypothetical protein ACYDCM_07260 [Candidatus Acidiferrales bacterium]
MFVKFSDGQLVDKWGGSGKWGDFTLAPAGALNGVYLKNKNRNSSWAVAAAQLIRNMASLEQDSTVAGYMRSAQAFDRTNQPIEDIKNPVVEADFPFNAAHDTKGVLRYLPEIRRIGGQYAASLSRTKNGQLNTQSIYGKTKLEVVEKIFQNPVMAEFVDLLPEVPAEQAPASESAATPEVQAAPKVLRPGSNAVREGQLPARPAAPESSEGDRRERAYQKAMIDLTTVQIKEAAKRDSDFASWLGKNMF